MTILSRNKVTNAGAELINSTIGGKNKITYTTAELYNKDISKLSDTQLAATTSIGTPIISGKCNVLNVTGTTVSIGSTIANGGLTADITFCTVGWFATTSVDQANGKPPVLIAISQLDAPTTLAHGGDNGKATAYFLPKLNIGIANTTQIKLEPTEAGFVTITELQQAMLALSSSGLIDLGNRLPNGMEVNRLHNTSLQYVPKGSVLGLPALEDKKDEDKDNDDSDRGGYLISMGNNELTQDGVQIYLNPYYNKTFVSFYNSKKNLWCDWIEVGSQSYTKDEINKMLANYATTEALNKKADASSVYTKDDIDEKIDQVSSNSGKFATPDDIKTAKTQLIKYLQQAGLFSDTDNVPTYTGKSFYLDDETAKNGLILLDTVSIALNDTLGEKDDYASFLVNSDVTRKLQLLPSRYSNEILHAINVYFGYLLTIPINDKYCYQILSVNFNYRENGKSKMAFRTLTRLTPIINSSNYDKDHSVPMVQNTNIEDIDDIADAILNKTVNNSTALKNFYPNDDTGNLRFISTSRIDLDQPNLPYDLGITRFDNCTLKVLSKPPYEIGLSSPSELLYGIYNKSLSGWLIYLPTGTDNEQKSITFPLQIVICYNKKVYDQPELADNMEIYYRIFDTSKKNNTNYFRKLTTKNDTIKAELSRKVFNFNNMINNTEGETTLEQVMNASSEAGCKKAKDVCLPLLFDLITDSKSISNSVTQFEPKNIPFYYKIINERIVGANNSINIYQEIKCLGFIFYRTGNISETSSEISSKTFNQWILKGTYNPISEYNNPMGDGSGLNKQINAFVLPDGSDINFVGTTTYSDYKLTNSSAPSIRFYPQGTYFLDAHRTYAGQPLENYNGYLVAMQTGSTRLQFISYITTGETINYIRSGGPTAIGQWKLI